MTDKTKDPLQLLALEARNFKALHFFAVEFPPDGGAVVVGGPNRAGKTSAVDSLRALLLGDRYKPTNPTRDGASVAAHVEALFGDGTKVERGGKNFSLKVTAPDDPDARQGLLDRRFARLAIDPSPLLNGNGKDRIEALLQSLPGVGEKLEGLDRQHDDLFSQRTTAGTLAKNAETQLAAMECFPDAPAEEIDISALAARISKVEEADAIAICAEETLALGEHFPDAPKEEVSVSALAEEIRAAEANNSLFVSNNDRRDRLQSKIDSMEAQLRELRAQLESTKKALSGIEMIDTAPLLAKLATAEADNAKVAANKRYEQSRAYAVECREKHRCLMEELGEHETLAAAEENNTKVRANAARQGQEADAAAKRAEHKRLDDVIASVRSARRALLEGADMPLPGLGIGSGDLTFNGQSWDGVAGSDRLNIVIQICRKQQPGCRFVVVGPCEEMDIDTLRRFSDACKSVGLLAICTRVSVGPEVDHVIENGRIVEAEDD